MTIVKNIAIAVFVFLSLAATYQREHRMRKIEAKLIELDDFDGYIAINVMDLRKKAGYDDTERMQKAMEKVQAQAGN